MERRGIRIVIADDELLVAEGLKFALEAHAPDLKVVDIACSVREVVGSVVREAPEIVLMKAGSPDFDGLSAAREIRRRQHGTRVILLTGLPDTWLVTCALSFGVSGCLSRHSSATRLVASIRAVNRGILQIESETTETRPRSDAPQEDPDLPRRLDTLTPRERDILRLIILPIGNKQVAWQLHVAEQTVRNYVSTIYAKLSIRSRMQLLRSAGTINRHLLAEDSEPFHAPSGSRSSVAVV